MKEIKELSDKARARLIEVMADRPTLKKFNNTEFELTSLHNGTLIEICSEVVKMKNIQMTEGEKTESVMLAMARQIPIQCRIITYALLNNIHKIKSPMFDEVYDIILTYTDQHDLFDIYFEVIKKLDVGFFFQNTEASQTLLKMLTDRRMTTEEQKAL